MLEHDSIGAGTASDRNKYFYRPSVQAIDEFGLGVFAGQYSGGLRESHLEFDEAFVAGGTALGRALEVICAGLLLVLVSPVLALVALALFFQKSGPVIYKQERLGLRGKIFNIYKFRTMVASAENGGPSICTRHSDPRITALGRFLRKTKIDELPQLVNVMKGDMAFIGPRPERPCFHDQFSIIYRWERRLSVKPGITGLAQVRPSIGHNPEKKIEADLEYIQTRNSALNLKILLLTPVAIVLTMGESDDADEGLPSTALHSSTQN